MNSAAKSIRDAHRPMQHISIQGHSLEYRLVTATSADAPTLVFLHEGLGSVSLWKELPDRVAAACGCHALVYSRYGNGGSDPLTAARLPDYMHREALDVLPELLDRLAIRHPILLGHSDGASIAIIFAGAFPARPAGLIALAPHVFVEEISVRSITAAREAYRTTDLAERLARHHAHTDTMFRGWNDIWLHPDFRNWRIEEYLDGIRCPVLAVQGYDDKYGTMAQLDCIRHHLPTAQLIKLRDCRHSPHRDQPKAVISAVAAFVRGIHQPTAAVST
jgi:pimeloyl-ACP methyl ester carboxylesterase